MAPVLLSSFPYLAGLGGLGIALFLFLAMRRMQADFQSRWNKRQQALQSELGRTRSLLQELAQRVEEAERRAEVSGTPQSGLKGINLNRRTQAMRMFRRGETAAQVASSLGIPQCQTELLMKVHKILSANAASAAGNQN
ncbi:MAG: hypothetical protein JST93_03030 [Acidobacteria bacterium]|nr:hypothetical protein [Acidobacteriota bacterium]